MSLILRSLPQGLSLKPRDALSDEEAAAIEAFVGKGVLPESATPDNATPPTQPAPALVPTPRPITLAPQSQAVRKVKAAIDASRRPTPNTTRALGTPEPDAARFVSYTLKELMAVTFPEERALLARGDKVMFRAGHIGEIYAERGVGKTWFTMSVALAMASNVEVLGFRNPSGPARVLYIDGEMSKTDIQERFVRLVDLLGVPAHCLTNLTIIGADWQPDFLPRVDTFDAQARLEPDLAAADCIIFDNRSTLFDPEGEKDPTAWQPAQDWLLSLRRRGKAMLLVHHSNRQGGARGLSKPEDPMNLLVKLTHPEDYDANQGARFIVEFDKVRGVYGPELARFIATLGPQGWTASSVASDQAQDAERKLREYLTLAHDAGARPTSATIAITQAHVNKANGLKAWAALKKTGALQKHPESGFYLVE